MPSATGNLSGSGPQQVYVWLSYSSMNIAGNYTTWYWELVFKNNGGQSWSADPNHTWALSGFAVGGPHYFGIPSSWVGSGDHLMGSGTFNKYHNAQGYLSAGNLTGTIDTTHTNIGDGSASVSSGTPPRVPKVPSAPPAPVFVSAETDSLDFTISGPADNGGSAIKTYEMRIVSADGATVVGSWTSGASAQTTVGKVVLDPFTSYRVLYRAQNGVGWGPYSAYTTMTTEAGIYVSDGTAWKGAGPRTSDGTAWAVTIPTISDGDSWEQPLDV